MCLHSPITKKEDICHLSGLIILKASGAIKWIQPHLPEVQRLRLDDEPGAGRERREVGVDHETHEPHEMFAYWLRSFAE